MVDFTGTNGSEHITGTSKDDLIVSGDGNDWINSGAGDDIVLLGDGNNKIEAGTGADIIITGNGNNVIDGGAGNDVIIAGSGNDIIAGDAGDDIMSGGAGADVFQFKAGFGHDIITDLNFGEGDYINLYAGAVGNAKNIQLKSQADVDALVTSGLATRTVNPDNGAVTLTFSTGDSITFPGGAPAAKGTQTGSSADNVLIGGTTPAAPTSLAHITGGAGDDDLVAAPFATNMEGGLGDDNLVGGIGNDLLTGNAGNDVLSGGRGDDQLNGGVGNDILAGGQGADTFVFSDKLGAFGNDIVTDFNFLEGDRLRFDVGGSSTTISTLAQLNSFVSSHGGVVTTDAVSATLTLGAGESIRFLGLTATGNTFN